MGFILILPFDTKPLLLLLIAFVCGILMDSFYDTIGINAFACVLIAFIRPHVLNLLTPGGGYDALTEISISYMGFVWFIKYAVALIFIHHFVFFFLEAWNITHFLDILIRSIMSSIFTLFVLVLLQYLFKQIRK
jgi:hypothetical protein